MPLPPTLDPVLSPTTAERIGVEPVADGVVGGIRAMACDVLVRVNGTGDRTADGTDDRTADAVRSALAVFAEVEAACTRFDPQSPLMQANRRGPQWTRVPQVCFDALVEAHRAHLLTGGAFDPRVHDDLVALGYDSGLCFGAAADGASFRRAAGPPLEGRSDEWRPRFRRNGSYVQVGERAVDLGGIGKGLAVRWATDVLRSTASDHLIDAGGDCWCGGDAPGGGPWLVGVEDPRVGDEARSGAPHDGRQEGQRGAHRDEGGRPVAVLALSDRACATSSVRVRRWRAGGATVHHLIDPATGLPGGHGLAAVTVVGRDPADAEVRAKALFLAGADGIRERARGWDVAALWVASDGTVSTTAPMEPYVVWRAG